MNRGYSVGRLCRDARSECEPSERRASLVRRAAAIVVLFTAVTVRAQEPRAAVSVSVTGDGVAHVTEHFLTAPDSGVLKLQLLSRPCARVGDLRVRQAGTSRTITPTRRGPWFEYVDSSGVVGATPLTVDVTYDVNLAGTSPDVPLAHPAHPVPRHEGGAMPVRLEVSGAAATFPHLARTGPTAASGEFVAVPAFVGLSGVGGASPCIAADGQPTDGGLAWRFWTLVAIMAAWVPLYLAWARRHGGSDE